MKIYDKEKLNVTIQENIDESGERNLDSPRNLSNLNHNRPINDESEEDFAPSNDLDGCNRELCKIELERDNTICRWEKLKYILFCYSTMLVLALLKESSYVPKCSFLYWFIFIFFFAISVFVDMISYTHILREYSYRKKINFPYDDCDIEWTHKNFISMNVIGVISGFIAGVIGIGGGIILGPILLSMGIYPIIGTVTTNFLVLITSSSTSIQFIISGDMNFQYAAIGVIFSAFGSYLGTSVIHHYIKKTKKESLLVFALALVIGLSALILPITSFSSSMEDYNRGVSIFQLNSPCKN